MNQKYYILKESDCYVIYKVDTPSVPAFEERQKDNIVVKASDLSELIIQFDKQKADKLELKKQVHSVSCQAEHKARVTKQQLRRNNGGY